MPNKFKFSIALLSIFLLNNLSLAGCSIKRIYRVEKGEGVPYQRQPVGSVLQKEVQEELQNNAIQYANDEINEARKYGGMSKSLFILAQYRIAQQINQDALKMGILLNSETLENIVNSALASAMQSQGIGIIN